MKNRTWLITLKKEKHLVTLLALATVAAILLRLFFPWATLVEILFDLYSAFSISDLPPSLYYAAIILFAVLLMALIWWALQVIPKRQARALQKPESPIVIADQKVNIEGFTYTPQSAVKPAELFSIENEARKTLSQIIGGFIVIVGLILTGANLAITSRLTQEGQITDRFTKAITQLGDEKLEVRLGGIYALERIAKDSEKDHWTIMEVLTAYVREHAHIKKLDNITEILSDKKAKDTNQPDNTKLPTDIQAILTVIGRRIISEERDKDDLHLPEIDLSNVRLPEAKLSKIFFFGADLSGATLDLADLSGAKLSLADLRRATLSLADLRGADLSIVDLRGASLGHAYLSGASLQHAKLSGADLREADLRGADLCGADLSEAKNLSWEQVSVTIIDEATMLPGEIENAHKDELRAMREKTKKEREGK